MERIKKEMIYSFSAFIIPFIIYLVYLAPSIVGGDSGELITTAYLLGVPHPPGYPLYTILGKLFSLIPFYSVAWRVNLLSALLDAFCCLFVFLTPVSYTHLTLPTN